MAIPQGANQRWSVDFISSTLADGRRFRILCVIDDFSWECLTTVVDDSISVERVARRVSRPSLHDRAADGTELTSNAFLARQEDRQVEWHYIAPGKPMQHGQWINVNRSHASLDGLTRLEYPAIRQGSQREKGQIIDAD